MTSEVRVRVAENIEKEAQRSAKDERSDPSGELVCLEFFLERVETHVAHSIAANFLVQRVSRLLPMYQQYILGAHTTTQADNRIVRHKRFWGNLRSRNLATFGDDVLDLVLPVDGGLRCFGLRRYHADHIDDAVVVVEEERASFLVAVPPGAETLLIPLVENGWMSDEQDPPAELLFRVSRMRGISFWPFGWFDDREAGVAAAVPSDLVECLS